MSEICAAFDQLAGGQTRIVVTHHPFDVPGAAGEDDLVGRARKAMHAFAKCGVDVFLAGHLHRTHHGSTARYHIPGYSALAVQAGTATSNRGRGEENSFNLIRVDRPHITIESYVWQPAALHFAHTDSAVFQRTPLGWAPADG